MDCDFIMRGFDPRRSPALFKPQAQRALFWKGDRVVEGVTLEMLCIGNYTEGSNPSLSVGDVAEW